MQSRGRSGKRLMSLDHVSVGLGVRAGTGMGYGAGVTGSLGHLELGNEFSWVPGL